MTRFRSFAAFLAAFVLLFSAALAEESVLDGLEVEEISFEDLTASGVSDDPADTSEAGDVFTPSYGSAYDHDLGSSYWTTPMDITDTETVWKMLMEPITVVDIGPKGKLNHSQLTKQNLYMYKEPDTSSKIIGEITNLSQGLRVIEKLDNGWSLVECYSSSFISKPATKIQAWNILVSGYVESKYL
ncbi:MAG: SH3 domain-containing protein, partial [Clostridia bacterium]|nr:SH3 domain-containing protein [Clostridia bacterium]